MKALLSLVLLFPLALVAQTPEWKAAAAKAVITPQEPMYLAGFAGREVPAESTAMELFAKTLAMEDNAGTRFVMVTLDLVEVPYQLRDTKLTR